MSTGRPDDPRPVDDAVDQAWRAASNEVPGSRIDAAILEAARVEANRDPRRSVDAGGATARKQRNWWTAWQPLAAAATVAGLAFALVQTMPRDRDVAPPIAVEQAQSEAAAPGPTTDEARDAGSAPAEADSSTADRSPAPAAPVPPPPAADATAAPLEAVAESVGLPAAEPPTAASAASRDEQPLRSRAAAPTPASAGVAAQAEPAFGESQRAMKSAASALTPEAWAARVEELMVAGDHAAAAAELRAFRAAHADADRYLPDDLHDWAGTVE